MDKKAKERVAIAKDALAWEKAGALIVQGGSYVCFDESIAPSMTKETRERQARDVVFGKCRVCVLGGLLLAKAVRYDAVSVDDVLKWRMDRLTDHFSDNQLNEIEAAFEGNSYPISRSSYSYSVNNDSWVKCFPRANHRFRAIMQNIIRNEGTFIPSDMTLQP